MRLRRFSWDEGKDAIQNVVLTIFEKVNDGSATHSLISPVFLFVAGYRALSNIRRAKRRFKELTAAVEPIACPNDHADLLEAIAVFLGDCSQRDQRIAELVWLEGASITDVASIVSMNQGHASRQVTSLSIRLHAFLADAGFDLPE